MMSRAAPMQQPKIIHPKRPSLRQACLLALTLGLGLSGNALDRKSVV